MINVPRLAKGHGYKGPEFFGCYNTGLAPSIFHSRTGKFVVGPELRCRDAMREGALLTGAKTVGDGRMKVWVYKTRSRAVHKFMELCGAQIMENAVLRAEYDETRARAAKGDLAAALHLGDF